MGSSATLTIGEKRVALDRGGWIRSPKAGAEYWTHSDFEGGFPIEMERAYELHAAAESARIPTSVHRSPDAYTVALRKLKDWATDRKGHHGSLTGADVSLRALRSEGAQEAFKEMEGMVDSFLEEYGRNRKPETMDYLIVTGDDGNPVNLLDSGSREDTLTNAMPYASFTKSFTLDAGGGFSVIHNLGLDAQSYVAQVAAAPPHAIPDSMFLNTLEIFWHKKRNEVQVINRSRETRKVIVTILWSPSTTRET